MSSVELPTFKRKLRALNYPEWAHLDLYSVVSVRNAVVWIEDQILRSSVAASEDVGVGGKQGKGEATSATAAAAASAPSSSPGHVETLRTQDLDTWIVQAFLPYLSSLGCELALVGAAPKHVSAQQLAPLVEWFVNSALATAFVGNAQVYNRMARASLRARSATSSISSLHVELSERDDVSPSPTLASALDALVKALNLATPCVECGPLDVLHTGLTVLLQRYAASNHGATGTGILELAERLTTAARGPGLVYEGFPTGIKATNDPLLDRCATVLRLLYVADLRELQSKVNELLVTVQNTTANIKVNALLGKVGR